MMTKLWKLLARYDEKHDIDNRSKTWESFASHNVYKPGTNEPVYEPDPNNPGKMRPKYNNDTSVSLESWHDAIHGLIGTGHLYQGHMANPQFADVRRNVDQSLVCTAANAAYSSILYFGCIIGEATHISMMIQVLIQNLVILIDY